MSLSILLIWKTSKYYSIVHYSITRTWYAFRYSHLKGLNTITSVCVLMYHSNHQSCEWSAHMCFNVSFSLSNLGLNWSYVFWRVIQLIHLGIEAFACARMIHSTYQSWAWSDPMCSYRSFNSSLVGLKRSYVFQWFIQLINLEIEEVVYVLISHSTYQSWDWRDRIFSD